jgi:hypothetical protein
MATPAALEECQASGDDPYVLEISEVWYLCEHEGIDVVVIAPEVEDQDQIGLQLRRPTIRLKPGSTAKDISWELWNLFPNTQKLIQ